MEKDSVPTYQDLLWPTLQAVTSIDGSGRIDEINRAIIDREGFGEDLQSVLHGEGPVTELEYRMAWARTYLKGMGLLDNSSRGVWAITEEGRQASPGELDDRHAAYAREARERSRRRRRDRVDEDDEDTVAGDRDLDDQRWKQELLDVLVRVPPDRFERLAQRVLREAGFTNTAVTGKSGDGGIDGVGTYRMSLISFNVFFQCKRYVGSVGAGAVRDFRGAMTGRGDKGLLITTGTFTAAAQTEATRDGAPPIDLIDGEGLCDLLRRYDLGVKTQVREVVEITPEFFDEI